MQNWQEQLPEWNEDGVQPPQQKINDGWQPGEKPPADWFNWLLNKTYKAFQEIRGVIDNLTGMEVHGNEYHETDFETPAGAQDKADTAEQNAKNYADATFEIPSGAQAKANAAEQNAKDYADTFGTATEQNKLFQLLLTPGRYKVTQFDTPAAGDISETIKLSLDNSAVATYVTEFDVPAAGNITTTLACTFLGIANKVVTEFDTPSLGDTKETASEVA